MKSVLSSVSVFITCLFVSQVSAQTQQFTAAGGSTFTVPASCLTIKVECIGGGGGGGRVTPSNPLDNDAAGGGGGGAYAKSIVAVTGGNVYNLYVGAGGTNTGTSTQGEDSWWDTNVVLADGGETRTGNDQESGVQGGQASNSIGDVTYSGGMGGNGNEGDADGGGGGGAAGSGGNGINGVTVTGGGPTANYGGFGGSGGDDGDYGASGGDFGGGGGGSSAQGSQDRNGGPGASGMVKVTWIEITGYTPQIICAGSNDTILITGSNFSNVDSVTVNGFPVTYAVNSGIQISILDPGTATSGEIIVYTDHGSATSITPLNIVSGALNVIADISGTVLTAQYSGGSGATYQWIDCIQGNAPVSGATDSVFNATANGLFAVIVTENGCSVQSSCITVTTATLEENFNSGLLMYPNPAENVVTFNSASDNVEQLILFNINGEQVINLFPDQTDFKMDLSEIESGIYIVHLVTSGKTSNLKLEVRH